MKKLLKKLFGETELYVSPLGRFITKVDKHKSAHSISQKKEIDYYKKIFALRDKAELAKTEKNIWDNF